MKIDLLKIAAVKELGHVATQRHPSLPLLIHNYTQRCQFDQGWDDTTLACRGLITDESGAIICRPFRKFFNVDEHERDGSILPPINWNQPFYVSEKLDGSLGILYHDEYGLSIATRGSFVSWQAQEATAIWRERYCAFEPIPGLTYLFEIIFPANRIVLDYGQTRDLFLLEIVANHSGLGAPRTLIESEAKRIGCPVVQQISISDTDAIRSYETGDLDREGIVVRFDDGMRVKIKLAEYKRLHRLITGINARKIWECLATGMEIDLERVPDEFFQWVTATKLGLLEQYQSLYTRATARFEFMRGSRADAPRKEYALEFLKERDISGLCFALLDGKNIGPLVWKAIYPAHSVPWKNGEYS